MAPNTLAEQVIKYLTDAHSIEKQAVVQMRMAPDLAGDPELAEAFSEHLTETEEHERLVRERLEQLDAGPSTVKDVAGVITGQGFGLFAAANPDTPGKLVAHAFAYEAMELAAYELLARVADRAGDTQTAALARRIGDQERAMRDRLGAMFDQAASASLRECSPDDLGEQLGKYLTDAHALEGQSIQLLSKAPELVDARDLALAYEDHLAESEEHQRLVERRLQARHERPSVIKDAALKLGALNWGAFFGAQPDTPAKLAGFSFAVEHLEIAAYELLRRVAQRAGDGETEAMAQQILPQEHDAADRIYSLLDEALDATLHEQGLAR
jgi:ferritin-like metal-binding protein YciE